jgi:hypothetical protein
MHIPKVPASSFLLSSWLPLEVPAHCTTAPSSLSSRPASPKAGIQSPVDSPEGRHNSQSSRPKYSSRSTTLRLSCGLTWSSRPCIEERRATFRKRDCNSGPTRTVPSNLSWPTASFHASWSADELRRPRCTASGAPKYASASSRAHQPHSQGC